MIQKLIIQNYALIESLEVRFQAGLNIITGETGTGKSILLGALSLILGERARIDMVRQGTDKAVIEAEIIIPDHISLDFLKDYLDPVPASESVILRREIHSSGRSRCFIDDTPVPLTVLSDFGDRLIDLHGQHEHQALFNTRNHLAYLDNFGGYEDLLTNVKKTYRQYQKCKAELEDLKARENTVRSNADLLAFQTAEIDKIQPESGEDDILENQERVLRNAEKLNETVQNLQCLLYEGDGSAVEQLHAAKQLIDQHLQIDDRFGTWAEECNSAMISVSELFRSIEQFVSKIDYNPERLESIRIRLRDLNLLKKKYGGSLEEVLRFYDTAQNELGRISSLDTLIAQKESELREIGSNLSQYCIQLSDRRVRKGTELSEAILSVLSDLGLAGGMLCIQVAQTECTDGPVSRNGTCYQVSENGIDHVEFMISLNTGELPKPLKQVASGGEISRIMLAIKTVLAETDSIPVLVFDEIDTGISGRIARVVGKSLQLVSQKRQVICITHLPQIASLGDSHYAVVKEVQEGRTRSMIKVLKEDDRIVEIAKLLGGEQITETAMQSARELLQ